MQGGCTGGGQAVPVVRGPLRERRRARLVVALAVVLGATAPAVAVGQGARQIAEQGALEGRAMQSDERRASCDAHAARASTDPVARHALGICYLLGSGRLTDHARAVELFASAAADGLREADFSLAAAWLFKIEDAARYREAFARLRALVDAGYAPAHFPLAVAYTAALGTPEDAAAAVRHYTAAAAAGDEMAAWLLAVAHRYGLLGLDVDPELGYRFAGRYLALVSEQFPDLRLSAQRLREAALGLHHDRLLRRFVLTDEQLELFLALAEEIATRPELAALRRDWAR